MTIEMTAELLPVFWGMLVLGGMAAMALVLPVLGRPQTVAARRNSLATSRPMGAF